MRQLLKATLILPLLLGVSTAVCAADDPAPPDANDIKSPTEAPAGPPANTSAAPSLGNVGDIGNVTSGKALPLTLKLSELGDNWRQLNISPQLEGLEGNAKAIHDLNNFNNTSQQPDPDEQMQTLVNLLGSGAGMYFTQGQTVTTGDNTFLVAYHARFNPPELKALFASTEKKNPVTTTQNRVTTATKPLEQYLRTRTLDLALLNLRQVGTMSNIQPFNMETQIANLRAFVASSMGTDSPHAAPSPQPATATASEDTVTPDANETTPATPEANAPYTATAPNHNDANANAINAMSVASLRELGAGLQNYLEDHDGVLPPLQDAAAAKAALKPYAAAAIFGHPRTKEAYLPNAILSGKKLAHITNPAAMVAFYEAHPAADGKRALLFLDGHVKRIKEAEWPLVKRASRIP